MRKKSFSGSNKKPADISVIAISDTTITNEVNTTDNKTKTNPNFFNGKPIHKDRLFLGVNNTIPCTDFYVDSKGDLHMRALIGESHICITETSDENLAIDFANNLFEHDNEGTMYGENTTTARAPRIKIAGNMVEIAESTLGTFRNYIEKNEDASKIILSKRIYYIQGTNIRKDKDGPQTSHARLYYCDPANEAAALALLKKICNANNQKLTIY